jgi:hypothetical protein
VVFSSEDGCEKAMKSTIHSIEGKKVECKYSFPKEKRKKKVKKYKKSNSEAPF